MSSKEHQREQNEKALITKLQSKGFGVKIDGSININTLITAGSLLVSGALAYAALDKRISVVEQIYSERSVRMEVELREVKQELKELGKLLAKQRDRS